MTQKTQPFKRGDTFSLTCKYKQSGQPVAITTQSFRSQLRTTSGKLISELIATNAIDQVAQKGVFFLRPANQETTKNWPAPGIMLCDIEISNGGVVISTETFEIPITVDQTI